MRAILFLGVILLASCASNKAPVPLVENNEIRDTVWITKTQTLRDTVFVTQRVTVSDTVEVEIVKNQFKPFLKESKKQNAKLKMWNQGNVIYADCQCDSLAIAAQIKDKIVEKTQKSSKVKTVILPRLPAKRYIPWYIKMLAWIGAVAVVFHGGKLLLSLYNPIKLFK